MHITPLSEAEAERQESGRWPDGEYSYEIMEADEYVKEETGNEVIKLTVRVFNDDGEHRQIMNWLTNTPQSAWRIRQFAASCGLLAEYEKGYLQAPQIIGRVGMCKLGTKESEWNGEKRKNNFIVSFLKKASGNTASAPKRAERAKAKVDDLDDDIPF